MIKFKTESFMQPRLFILPQKIICTCTMHIVLCAIHEKKCMLHELWRTMNHKRRTMHDARLSMHNLIHNLAYNAQRSTNDEREKTNDERRMMHNIHRHTFWIERKHNGKAHRKMNLPAREPHKQVPESTAIPRLSPMAFFWVNVGFFPR